MKKWAGLLLICSMLFGLMPSAHADSATMTAALSVEDSELTVSGVLSTGNSSWISLRMTGPEGELAHLDQTTSDSNGSFTFVVPMAGKTAGEYEVVLGAAGLTGGFRQEVTYTPPVTLPPVVPIIPEMPESKVVQLNRLNWNSDGSLQISLGSKQGLKVPVQALQVENGKQLQIEHDSMSVNIPAAVLNELMKQVPASAIGQAELWFTVSKAEGEQSLSGEGSATTGLHVAGDRLELELFVLEANGTKHQLAAFPEPLKLSMSVDNGADKGLVGIYYIPTNGAPEYVGGIWDGSKLTAMLDHFSTYAVLEYKKTFEDVPAHHWAQRVIQELAAKHLMQGVSESKFAPDRSMTRAEFTATLVRALKLESAEPAPFADVEAGSWYADEVAAAYAAGLIAGKSSTVFAPEAQLTREEMAVILMNAARIKQGDAGKTASGSANAAFQDEDAISDWAVSAVHTAAEAGYVKGRGNGQFVPKGLLTRAEAAQVVYRMFP
ncbi:S-layer homology domain-containing protein [Paenibacillus soyae]|uniref:S-layer homology domain-containing protein n=1 Tax=Paenibacillus soyae TaxID=2969249 RepID=A0A9X2S9F2_9BACL|nr:S-layer homology domain-containing protein [Paenibacillus soyae]MCR2802687.1 S-layer homology domain-containing protein [Paenibacillus soyae]